MHKRTSLLLQVDSKTCPTKEAAPNTSLDKATTVTARLSPYSCMTGYSQERSGFGVLVQASGPLTTRWPLTGKLLVRFKKKTWCFPKVLWSCFGKQCLTFSNLTTYSSLLTTNRALQRPYNTSRHRPTDTSPPCFLWQLFLIRHLRNPRCTTSHQVQHSRHHHQPHSLILHRSSTGQ